MPGRRPHFFPSGNLAQSGTARDRLGKPSFEGSVAGLYVQVNYKHRNHRNRGCEQGYVGMTGMRHATSHQKMNFNPNWMLRMLVVVVRIVPKAASD